MNKHMSQITAHFLIFLFITLRSFNALASFDELSQPEKDQALKNYSTWSTLSPDKKQKLEKNWESFQKLAPEQKASLVERNEKFRGLNPQRKSWLQRRVSAREHRISHRRRKHQSRSKTRRNTASASDPLLQTNALKL